MLYNTKRRQGRRQGAEKNLLFEAVLFLLSIYGGFWYEVQRFTPEARLI